MFGPGEMVVGVSWAGTHFDAIVTVDHDEVRRRHEVGLGAVTDFRLLELLGSLPHRLRVPWSAIDPVVAAYLDCIPAGLIDSDSQHEGVS
jgi:hypothetical protein